MEKVEEQYDSCGLYATICALAVRKKMSLSEVERKLNFSSGLISTWKNSVPGIDKVIKVANFFNISIDELIGFKEKQHVESIAKIAKMIFLMETNGFDVVLSKKELFTDYSDDLTIMECKLMLLLLQQLNLNISEEYESIITKTERILGKSDADPAVNRFKTKQYVLDVAEICPNDNFKKDIEDAKKLIDFYDKI